VESITKETLAATDGDRIKLISMATFRARQLQRGATPRIENKANHKPTVLALLEIEAGAYTMEDWEYDKRPKTEQEIADEHFSEEG
jgi:DNA-directed RNA polymerase omega subunit